MHKNGRLDDHQKFKELAALAHGAVLGDDDWAELKSHLQGCDSCREAYEEYSWISRKVMPFLSAATGNVYEAKNWDEKPARNKLFADIRENERKNNERKNNVGRPEASPFIAFLRPSIGWAAVAACILLAIATGAYHLGKWNQEVRYQAAVASLENLQPPGSSGKNAIADDLFTSQAARITRLQEQTFTEQQELARLRTLLRAAEDHAVQIATAGLDNKEQLRQATEQRDQLANQLRDAQQAYQNVSTELANLHADHDRVVLRASSLESKIGELTASGHDQDRRLKDDEQYLASDRDIRELMGARKLYIADVFDVDSGSRTRKPFGRVFYTQSKSLIFYAFDLDHQPGVKNASTFQVWGQKDGEAADKPHAMNLGILYMDSESNRRWVLRLEDPTQLAEIDAVFVTVEPHGGSQKPTGKPFLYALLRKEANHP